MLHTVLPLEDVLEGIEEEPRPTMQLMLGGVTVEAEPLGISSQGREGAEHRSQAFLRAPLPTGYSNPRCNSLSTKGFSYGQI